MMTRMERLSVIIPALDAAAGLGDVIDRLTCGGAAPGEIIVVDGGSADGTTDVARSGGAIVLSARRGRGIQMAAGAAAAKGDWFLFLHADTVPGSAWRKAAADLMAGPGGRRQAGVFRFRLDDPAPWARCVEWCARCRSRLLGLPYGDQGLLISAEFYESLGGFRPMVIMEDVDMVRRIGRRRLITLDCDAHTSAVRYRRAGYGIRVVRNAFCLACYFCGVPPSLIARMYG
ncbi:MAG: TIGR04283 family arsenosugar biosynthesis glycosyltransferase [Alphaproteobacteria bacterium]|nr:TIGR04283 family arsenosugar biosynthesis glycosyltransferase [Alphaproteobacteria bacterium]